MALQELYGDYKPQGLVGGMVSGLNTGANLGSMFANTASTNQQTSAREQKLPWEIAQSAANVDKDVMANDTTRATQAGQIAATNATNKTAIMTNEQAQQIIPYETFNKVFQQQSQQAAVKFTEAAQRIRNGEYDSVFSELLQSAQKPEEKAAIQKVYQQYKNKPQEAAAYAQKMAEKSEWDRLNTDPEKVFEMWKITAMNAAKLQQERIQASAKGSDSQPNYNLVFVKKLAQRIKEQNPTWSAAQVEAEAVRQYKSTTETTPIGNTTFQTNKAMASTPQSNPTLPATPSKSGWVKGSDGVMRKQ